MRPCRRLRTDGDNLTARTLQQGLAGKANPVDNGQDIRRMTGGIAHAAATLLAGDLP